MAQHKLELPQGTLDVLNIASAGAARPGEGGVGRYGESPPGDELTRAGHEQLKTETEARSRLTAVVGHVLESA
jgi:hypothetical protein